MRGKADQIKVLIVDDSQMAREMVREILSEPEDITVVGEAANGLEAIRLAAELHPDIITMDIEMPIMGGLEAIEKIIAQQPVPILVVTSHNDLQTAFDAVSKGALEAVEKPDISPESSLRMIYKIRTLSKVNPLNIRPLNRRTTIFEPKTLPTETLSKNLHTSLPPETPEIIAIAASTGGPQALQYILTALPENFPVPILITQHIAEGFTEGMAKWFNASSSLTVKMARDLDKATPGYVYLNPSENSMTINRDGIIHLGERDCSTPYNPSCNVMLKSVGSSYGNKALALIMSGMGDDGADGMEHIKMLGGITLAQDEDSSVIFGMNQKAIERGCIDKVVSLSEIPDVLMKKVGCH